MGQPKRTDISRFFDRHSIKKRQRRDILKKEGDRETEHERRIYVDNKHMEMI
jgi:hypothetical protein